MFPFEEEELEVKVEETVTPVTIEDAVESIESVKCEDVGGPSSPTSLVSIEIKTPESKFIDSRNSDYRIYSIENSHADKSFGYGIFGLSRKESYDLLTDNLYHIRYIMINAVFDELKKQDFYDYLINKGFISNNIKFSTLLHNLNQWSNDLRIIQAFVDYNVRDGKSNKGWPHPVVAQSLCFLSKINCFIWSIGPNKQLIANDLYPSCICDGSIGRLDLVSIDSSKFERITFPYGPPKEGEHIYPAEEKEKEKKTCCEKLCGCFFLFGKEKYRNLKEEDVIVSNANPSLK